MQLKDMDSKLEGEVMKSLTKIRAMALALGAALVFASSAPVFAQRAGGHFGGFHGGGFRGGFGGHYYGGFRGGYGWGGYGYGPWGLGLGGLGLGLYFASLPYYYSTYWWGGVPYYYADNTYYRWNEGVSQYETVAPPPGLQNQGGSGSAGGAGGELIAYPKNGQSESQQSKDKYECHHWAAGQTGFDPSQGSGAGPVSRRSDYLRAQAACLEGRGYSVR
jgi:hypothetical protein